MEDALGIIHLKVSGTDPEVIVNPINFQCLWSINN